MEKDRVGKDMIMKARSVHFAHFMEDNYPELIKREGVNYGRSTENPAFVFGPRYYSDNRIANKEKQDAIHYLKTRFGISFQEAVRTLCAYAHRKALDTPSRTVRKSVEKKSKTEPKYPPVVSSDESDMKVVRDYLKSHCIELTEELGPMIHTQREQGMVNAVFMSRECNYGETRGTYTSKVLSQLTTEIIPGSDSDGYFIVGSQSPKSIFICTDAVDAISLQIYLEIGQDTHDSAFASIGDIYNTLAIERIKRTYPAAEIVIAFNNDDAGNRAASKLPYKRCQSFCKNWNEELAFIVNMKF